MVDGKSALIIANSHYQDPDLRQLVAPAYDAQALARVLESPAIGGFEVRTLLDKPAQEVSQEIEKFFLNRRRGDLLLLYFSGHGIKDDDGLLYFATTDTHLIEHGRPLRSSAVSAEFVKDVMRCSKSRRQILVLDCCYSGAFASALLAKGDKSVGIKERFAEGRGMVVITASDALQYSFEGNKVEGEAQRSVFTRTLVEGIETGKADLNHDGEISLDELYEYVYEHVSDQTPEQRPKKWDLDIEGKILLAHSPTLTPADLPPELLHAIASPLTRVRQGAVEELGILLHGPHKGLALAAQHALMSLKDDDSRRIAAAAEALLPRPSAAPAAVEPPVAPPSVKETPLPPPIKAPLQPAATAAPAKSTAPPRVVEIKQAPDHKIVHLEQVVPAELPPPPPFTHREEAPQPPIPPALHKVTEIKQAPELKAAHIDIPPPVAPASAPQDITPATNELRVVPPAKAAAQMAEISKFCTRCGNSLRGTETFCTKCGQAQKTATQKIGKPWKLWKLLILIVVGLWLLGTLVAVFSRDNQPRSEPAPQPTSTPAAAMPSPVTTAPAATLPAPLPAASPEAGIYAPAPTTLSDPKNRIKPHGTSRDFPELMKSIPAPVVIETNGAVCADPAAPCTSLYKFRDNELSFRLPDQFKLLNSYSSATFYAIILKSLPAVDNGPSAPCTQGIVPEPERQRIQAIFPRQKVFTSTSGCYMTPVWYTNTNTAYNFVAVYAGESAAQAQAALAKVRATGQFPGANVREMQVVLRPTG